MEWSTTIILGLIILILLYWKAFTSVHYWKKRGIPYVTPVPFFGNTMDIVLKKKSLPEVVLSIYNQLHGEKFGGFMLFARPVILIRDPELISRVLIKNFSHFHDRGFPMNSKEEPLTATLITLTGNRWRLIRHKLTPTFTSGKLKNMFDQVLECTDKAIDFLEGKNEVIDVKKYTQKFILNVIGLVAFGLKFETWQDNEESQKFFKYSTKFFAPSTKTLINLMLRTSFPCIGEFLNMRFLDPEVSDFFMNLVKDTINYREKTNTRRNDFIQLMLDFKQEETLKFSNQLNGNTHHSMNNVKDEHMDAHDEELLKQLGNAPSHHEYENPVFNDDCITAQSFIFISAGNETASSLISFALYHLATNNEVQRKVQNEIAKVLAAQQFDYYAVEKLVYLEQFIYEVMRLHPPAGALSRVCTEDFLIPGTDKVIEKGVLVSIPILGLNMDPQYFPDPEKFDPDRFENMKNIPKGVFLPFGDGPRICIAKRLAMMEIKIFLTRLLSKYNVVLSKKTQLPLKMDTNALVPNIVGGLWIHFEKRSLF